MITMSEVISNVQALKGGGARFQVPITPNKVKKINIRPAHLRSGGAFIRPPDLNQNVGFQLSQMRKKKSVGQFGDKASATGLNMLKRNVPPGMAFANTHRNVPRVPIRR